VPRKLEYSKGSDFHGEGNQHDLYEKLEGLFPDLGQIRSLGHGLTICRASTNAMQHVHTNMTIAGNHLPCQEALLVMFKEAMQVQACVPRRHVHWKMFVLRKPIGGQLSTTKMAPSRFGSPPPPASPSTCAVAQHPSQHAAQLVGNGLGSLGSWE